MSVRLDMSEVEKLAADLGLSVSRVEQALDKALDAPAAKLESAQKAKVRRRSGKTHDSINVSKPGPLVRLVGADHFVGRFLERGTSKMPPFPWLEEGLPEVMSDTERAAMKAVERLLGGR